MLTTTLLMLLTYFKLEHTFYKNSLIEGFVSIKPDVQCFNICGWYSCRITGTLGYCFCINFFGCACHHVATAFKETSHFSESNIFQNLEEYVTMFHGVGCLIYMCGYQNRSSYHTLRTSIMEMVLATDMSKHFDYLSKFKCMITREVCKHL